MFCCTDWPYGGATDEEVFKVMDYLKVSKQFTWQNCSNRDTTIKDLLNTGSYMVLVKGHYLIVSGRKVINGGYYSNKTPVIGYWRHNQDMWLIKIRNWIRNRFTSMLFRQA